MQPILNFEVSLDAMEPLWLNEPIDSIMKGQNKDILSKKIIKMDAYTQWMSEINARKTHRVRKYLPVVRHLPSDTSSITTPPNNSRTGDNRNNATSLLYKNQLKPYSPGSQPPKLNEVAFRNHRRLTKTIVLEVDNESLQSENQSGSTNADDMGLQRSLVLRKLTVLKYIIAFSTFVVKHINDDRTKYNRAVVLLRRTCHRTIMSKRRLYIINAMKRSIRFTVNLRCFRKVHSAALIITFLKCRNPLKIWNQLRCYIKAVRLCQKVIRSFLEINRNRINVVRKYLEKLSYSLRYGSQKRDNHSSVHYESKANLMIQNLKWYETQAEINRYEWRVNVVYNRHLKTLKQFSRYNYLKIENASGTHMNSSRRSTKQKSNANIDKIDLVIRQNIMMKRKMYCLLVSDEDNNLQKDLTL